MAKITKQLTGTGVAIVTPFTKEGKVDFPALVKLIGHIVKGKCEYLVPLGTTGESVVLSDAEYYDVLSCTLECANGKIPVVAGLGGNNTAAVLKKLQDPIFEQVSAILSVSPYYNKPNQQGIQRHYRAIADQSPVPVILYNVPGRTGSNVQVDTTLELAKHKNIIGVKEASGNVEQIMEIIRRKPEGFLVISGDDSLTLPLIAAGADGVISVVANAYPKHYSEMVRLCLKGDFVKARKLHYEMLPLVPFLFAEGNPAGIKSALKQLKVCGEDMRLPNVPVGTKTATEIGKFIRKFK